MPKCKNDPNRKYKGTEPSPKGLGWCAHGEKEGKKRKGKDGNIWIVKVVKNGSRRWIKCKKEGLTNNLDKYLKKNKINIKDEKDITEIFYKNKKIRKEYTIKFIRKILSKKTKDVKKLNIIKNRNISIYDEYLDKKKINIKLEKGNYEILLNNNYLGNISSMIVIKNKKIKNLKDIKISKTKKIIEIGDSQIIKIDNIIELKLQGKQFFGSYNVYIGKKNKIIKIIAIPLINFLNEDIVNDFNYFYSLN